MKQPFTVTVAREHGNVGDVVVTVTDARGEVERCAVPGEANPYTSVAALAPFIERLLNEWTEPKAGVPYVVVDPANGDAHVLVDSTSHGVVPLPAPKHVEDSPETPPTDGEP